MIKKIFSEGKPKDKATENAVNNILNDLENNDLEFVVGIDYASIHSDDFTAVAQFFENEDGSLTYAGSKLV